MSDHTTDSVVRGFKRGGYLSISHRWKIAVDPKALTASPATLRAAMEVIRYATFTGLSANSERAVREVAGCGSEAALGALRLLRAGLVSRVVQMTSTEAAATTEASKLGNPWSEQVAG